MKGRGKKKGYGRRLIVLLAVSLCMGAVFPGTVSHAEDTEPTNVALGKTVTQQYNGGTAGGSEGSAEPLVDGSRDRSAYWDGGDAPASFTIDLGQEYVIQKMAALSL